MMKSIFSLNKLLILVFSACILFTSSSFAQEKPLSREKQKKALKKKKEDQIKAQRNIEVELKKRHLTIQEKQTRKRMKKSKKKSEKLNRRKRRY